MLMKVSLVIVLGCLSAANAQTPFCSGELCFIRPEPNSPKSWTEAQNICKDNNSTLPIVDNPDHQMSSFVAALSHFQLNGTDVWLGATASDNGPGNWRWLDGSQYIGTDAQNGGEYIKSYAFVANSSTGVLAYASPVNKSYSYICQYSVTTPDGCTNGTGQTAFVQGNRCYIMYNEKLSWFSARNTCLANHGDLASISNLSLLYGLVDSSGSWVGLRHSQWNWQNAVTGLSSDVTFTSWRIGQPDGAAPQCIATDSGDFPNWKDFNCTYAYSYICQVNSSSTIKTNPPLGTTGSSVTSASTSVQMSSTTENNKISLSDTTLSQQVDVPLAIGLGVGLGVPVIILIVVVIVVVAVRRKHRNSNGNSASRKGFVFNGRQKAQQRKTAEMNETRLGRNQLDNSVGQYASIREATGLDSEAKVVPPSNNGIVYADLQFAQGSS